MAVARALINNPDVVLADEPSGNLDSHNKKELHELFFNLREKYNQTFIIVTHDNSLAEMSDRIAAIAPVAGTIAIRESEPTRPVPVIHFHGTKDKMVPFETAAGKVRPARSRLLRRADAVIGGG